MVHFFSKDNPNKSAPGSAEKLLDSLTDEQITTLHEQVLKRIDTVSEERLAHTQDGMQRVNIILWKLESYNKINETITDWLNQSPIEREDFTLVILDVVQELEQKLSPNTISTQNSSSP